MEDLIHQLRELRISVTPQRLAVLAAIRARCDHPTAEQIYQEVRRQLPVISFNTVYKSLEVLCNKGLAVKVNPLHEVAHYDGRTHDHSHLICRDCHYIADLPFKPQLPAFPEEHRQGFEVGRPSLVYWGLCPKCQKNVSFEEE